MLGMCIMWIVCYILTATNVFPQDENTHGYWARTDVRMDAIYYSAWFRVPYPCTVILTSIKMLLVNCYDDVFTMQFNGECLR